MDMKHLDKLAKAGEELPQGLTSYKQSYYISSRGLYKQYERGEVDLARARLEKEKILVKRLIPLFFH